MESKQLQQLFTHLEDVITWRINNPSKDFNIEAPEFSYSGHEGFSLGDFISEKELAHQEVIILLMALLPRLDPSLLRRINLQTPNSVLFDLCMTNDSGRLFYPTIQSIQYILGGDNILGRLEILEYFNDTNVLIKEQIINFSNAHQDSPISTGISVYQEAFNRIVSGVETLPKMSEDFPAEQLQTNRSWSDLILPKTTLIELQSIEAWYTSSRILMEDWGMQKTLKPGYRVLFHGEPGTGKTLAASLLGKYTKRPVFRVDVSMLVSKYIGETEKHLAKLFDKAENKDWILFFDEADAIFGKRTNVRDAHDKYANQEVSYLLQRIETFSGLIILASNYKNNMDKAFMRRFHSCIKFSNPKCAERLHIWKQNLPKQLILDGIDLEEIAKRYELTGSSIMNIIQDMSLKTIALKEPDYKVSQDLLLESIKKEYLKEDRVFV